MAKNQPAPGSRRPRRIVRLGRLALEGAPPVVAGYPDGTGDYHGDLLRLAAASPAALLALEYQDAGGRWVRWATACGALKGGGTGA